MKARKAKFTHRTRVVASGCSVCVGSPVVRLIGTLNHPLLTVSCPSCGRHDLSEVCRQALEQRKLREEGRCTSCWGPSDGYSRCSDCREKVSYTNTRGWKTTRSFSSPWDKLPWRKIRDHGLAPTVAKELKVPVSTVYYHMNRRGMGL
jgi:hypothetical protein